MNQYRTIFITYTTEKELYKVGLWKKKKKKRGGKKNVLTSLEKGYLFKINQNTNICVTNKYILIVYNIY